MIRFELDTLIARPIEDVFAQLIDLPGYRRWMPRLDLFIRSDQTSEGPMAAGTTYYDKTWMGTYRGEVVELCTPTTIAFRETLRWWGIRVAEARPAYQLLSTEAGTEVHHVAEGEFFGILRLMGPVGAWIARGERKRTLRALRQALEQGRESVTTDHNVSVLLKTDGVGPSERNPVDSRTTEQVRARGVAQ
jgi:uncharacterized protein YndB with AHSA1/START domain